MDLGLVRANHAGNKNMTCSGPLKVSSGWEEQEVSAEMNQGPGLQSYNAYWSLDFPFPLF